MKFSGVTIDVQTQYPLDESFLTSSCEYEEWDTPEKLCHLLFESTPLIGEVRLSSEQYQDFSKRGQQLFAKLMMRSEQALSLLEKQMLAAAVVFHVQQADDNAASDDDNGDQLWSNILKNLGFDEITYGCKEQNASRILKKLLQETLRVSTEHGKKYYNTLKMQALAPAASISELYNIIYQFYKLNLECQYDEAENAFIILSQNIQKKITKNNGADNIDLGSSFWALKSSLKVLFQYHPEYMAAVCDAIAKKIDLYLRGDDPNFCDCNRWDALLRQWFQAKSKAEQDFMRKVRAKRVHQKIITKKEAIHPQYRLQNEEWSICLPRLRLPEITRPPMACLYQDGKLVAQARISVYGDPMCYTTHEFSFALNHIKQVTFTDNFEFQVKIECDGNTLYDSQTLLYRRYLVFNESGYESTLWKCQSGKAWIVAPFNADVNIVDPEDDYYDESSDFQMFRVSLYSAAEIWINRVNILAQESQKDISIRGYCIPDAVNGASLYCNGKQLQIYRKQPKLRVILGEKASAKSYQLFLDSSQRPLYEYIGENHTGEIDLPGSARFCHQVKIVEFQTRAVVFEASYIILSDFSVYFDSPYYLNKECRGEVTIRFSGGTCTHAFELAEDQISVQFSWLRDGFEVLVDVPKVNITANGENMLYWPEQKWYEDISQNTFIKTSAPAGVQIDFLLNGKTIPQTSRGKAYELGNFIYANEWDVSYAPLDALIRSGGCLEQLKIADIYFTSAFLASPLIRDNTCIIWEPDSNFIGPGSPKFTVELENDVQNDPWIYRQLQPGKPFEKNFSCKPGSYECKVFLDLPNDNPFVVRDRRQLVWEETFQIEERPECRFDGKFVRLMKVWFWSCETRKIEMAKFHYNDAVIFDIEYIGMRDFDGEFEPPVPTYEGVLSLRAPDQRWNYMNNDPENEQYENINPVSFCVVQGNRVKVYNADGEPLLLDVDTKVYLEKGYVRIKNRKWDCPPEEAWKRFPIADEFAFREEDDF